MGAAGAAFYADMKVEIRPAHQADADRVAVFLNRHMDKRIPAEHWRRLFHLPWPLPADAPDYGRVAVSGGEVVGFVSRIYSERTINGRRELIANLSSWYMRKDLRKGRIALRLYRELLDDRGHASYTILSVAKRTYPVHDRWGVGVLDAHRWLWRRNSTDTNAVEVLTDVQAIDQAVTSEQQQMLHYHRSGDLRSALLRTAHGDCLIVLTIHHKRDEVFFYDVLHLSEPALFERHAAAVANLLLPNEQSALAVDSRFVSDSPPGGERIPIYVPRRYVSDHLTPASLDMLYSEFVLLDLKPS